MRVLVFSTPSTTSSYVIELIAKKLNLKNYYELYNNLNEKPTIQETLNFIETNLYNQDDYAIKIMAPTLKFINAVTFDDINWSIFDKIIFTERDIYSQIFSTLIKTNSYPLINDSIYIEIDNNLTNKICRLLKNKTFYTSCKNILLTNFSDKCVTLTHELFRTSPVQYLAELNTLTNLNFSIDDLIEAPEDSNVTYSISNYNEVKNLIDELMTNTIEESPCNNVMPFMRIKL